MNKIEERYYNDYKTPFHNNKKYYRWYINNRDERNIFHPSEWCISFFDSDLRNNNRV